MVKANVVVIYPAGGKFDKEYYLHTHMPLVAKQLGPYGLESWRISTLSNLDGSDGAFQVQADLIFADTDSVRRAFKQGGKEVIADIPAFTDRQATLLVGDVFGEGHGEK